jgi:hypothetical protein
VVTRLLLRAALAGTLLLGASARATPDAPTEWDVKAAYLYNFTLFVEWPEDAMPSPTAPFVVGIVGPDPFGQAAEATFAGKTVGAHPVVVRRLASPEESGAVQILFVASPSDREAQRAVRAAQGKPVFTVADGEGAASRGSILTFHLKENRVRFDVNLAPARAARLKISSQLLKLALSVEGP